MNTSEKTLAALRQHLHETALLESTMALLEWDEHTGMPDRAGDYRSEQLMLLSGFVHQRKTDPRIGEWLAQLSTSDVRADPYSPVGALIRCVRRDYDKNVRLPETLIKHLAKATSLGQQVWVKAKRDNDYAAFQPALHEIISLRREEASLLASDGEPLYDALLDQYEEGAKSKDVASVFEKLRDALIPWVRNAQETAQHAGPSSVEGVFDIEAQRTFSRWVAKKIGFDFERGRLDETVHPFCTTLGPHDHRILTRYSDSSFSTGLYGVLHEAGHGMYEQGLEQDWYGTPVATAASLGVHESQSRLWENMVGLSRPFWDWCMPEARKLFPSLEAVAIDRWVRDLNRVQCSLIRIEADEVTYNMHILIRFELEMGLIAGDLNVADLPEAWSDKYQNYLGIRPPNDALGVLQDVHWSAGLIGYFPTYTLGNIFAAQLYEAADRELGGVGRLVAKGEFAPLLAWLREKVHRFGRRYPPMELIEKATGKAFSSDALIRHLRTKVA